MLESLFYLGLVGAALTPVNHRLGVGGIRAVLADMKGCWMTTVGSMSW
jgi:hypothetical protein